jgi:hypothetical protein
VSSISSVIGRAGGSSRGISPSSEKPVRTCLTASSGAMEDRSSVRVRAVLDALQGGDGGDQLGGRGQVQHVVEPLRPLLARQQGALAERLVVDEATLGVSGTNDGAVDLAGVDGRMEASLDVVGHGGGKRPIRFQLKKERDTERVSAEKCLEGYLLLSVRDYPHGALFISALFVRCLRAHWLVTHLAPNSSGLLPG